MTKDMAKLGPASKPGAQRRAEGAFEIAVLDHLDSVQRPAHVVRVRDRRNRRRTEVGQTAASPSKIKLAPGSSLGEEA